MTSGSHSASSMSSADGGGDSGGATVSIIITVCCVMLMLLCIAGCVLRVVGFDRVLRPVTRVVGGCLFAIGGCVRRFCDCLEDIRDAYDDNDPPDLPPQNVPPAPPMMDLGNLEEEFFPNGRPADGEPQRNAPAGNLADFNLVDGGVQEARLFQEGQQDDARLNDMVRLEMIGHGPAPDHAVVNVDVLPPAGPPAEEDQEVHPLIVAQQELAAVSRGESPGPVPLLPAYARYATKSFEKQRWRSRDGAAASFQAHDLYAGVLYPYALSVTAYSSDSLVVKRYNDSVEEWARALRGTVIGLCVADGAEGAKIAEEAGVAVSGGDGHNGVVAVVAVTPIEPEGLSIAELVKATALPPTAGGRGRMGPHHWQAVARRVVVAFSDARASAVHAVLHPAAVFVDPHHHRVTLKDRRATAGGGPEALPDEAAAVAELRRFLRHIGCDFMAGFASENVLAAETTSDGGAAQLEPTTVSDVVKRVVAAAPAPATLAFLDDGHFPIAVATECSVCYADIESTGPHLQGAECCAPARHFVCEECINMRVSTALKDAVTEFTSLPCAMSPACTSVWTFDDFGAMVTPQNIQAWQKLCVDKARRAARKEAAVNLEALQRQLAGGAQVSAAQAELRQHMVGIRRCLRPACPHCGMPFESFSGCLAVKCGAQDNNGRQVQGCGKEFCGACMVPAPCPKRCGHRFVSQGELFTLWKEWRRARVQQYFASHLSGDERRQMRGLALRGCQGDLDQAGIDPLYPLDADDL